MDLGTWIPITCVLGLALMGLCVLFLKGCEHI